MNENESSLLRRQLRTEMKKQRQALSASQRDTANRKIQHLLYTYVQEHPFIRTIMSFFPIQNEAVPLSVSEEDAFFASGKTLLLPRVESLNPPEMAATVYQGLQNTPGTYTAWDIFEPSGPAIDPQTIDCVLVPGLAFDQAGYRLGYGRGFYDRFLPLLRPDAVSIGIGYSFQLVASTWPQSHDIRLQALMTEKGLQYF